MFHQWGGPSSTDRAEALMEEVLGMFQGVDKIYKDVCSLNIFHVADTASDAKLKLFNVII